MSRLHKRDVALLSEASAKNVLVIRVYERLDLVWAEKCRHDAAERLRQAGYLRCRVKLGERRTVHGDIWAEYELAPAGADLLARRHDLAARGPKLRVGWWVDVVRGLRARGARQP